MILGGTVGELQHRMSAAEFGRWCKYFIKHGRIDPVRMFDFAPAMVCWKIDHALGGKSEIKNYLPYSNEPEKETTVQDMLNEFGVTKRGI